MVSDDLSFSFEGSEQLQRFRTLLLDMLNDNTSSLSRGIVLVDNPDVSTGPNQTGHPHHESEADEVADEEKRYFNIYALRHKWAARFTSSSFTHGAASTQRGEGVFSEVKRSVLGGVGLIELYEQIDQMVEKKTAANIFNMTKLCLRQNITLLQQPLIRSLKSMGCSAFSS